MTITIPRPILDRYAELNSCNLLSKDKVKDIVSHGGINYVIGGSCSSHKEGNISVSAYKCVLLSQYTGSLKPLSYYARQTEVWAGKRPRGYAGQFFWHKGKKWVITADDRVTFIPDESGTQIQLF